MTTSTKLEEHQAWVQKSLAEMETIKVGMTRRQMRAVFVEEGGISTDIARTYAYKDCPYFKVDFEFTPVGRPARDPDGRVTLRESDDDVIAKLSRPYIQLMIVD